MCNIGTYVHAALFRGSNNNWVCPMVHVHFVQVGTLHCQIMHWHILFSHAIAVVIAFYYPSPYNLWQPHVWLAEPW